MGKEAVGTAVGNEPGQDPALPRIRVYDDDVDWSLTRTAFHDR